MFKPFRGLIEAIWYCTAQMKYFIILLLALVFMFAVMNYVIEEIPHDEKRIIAQLGMRYQVVFGENPEYDWNTWQGRLAWLAYFIFTIIMNIVMLNLLIQLVSDKYGELMANEKSTDARAMI